MSTDLSLNPSDHKTEPSPRWDACFEAAIEYFAGHVDDNISAHATDGAFSDQPSTAREYFNERGWTNETVKEYHLGWAPVEGRGSLQDHLKQQGYSDEEILATGLFNEDLETRWKGRYVLPYLNEHGEPVFAISRETKNNSHPEDYLHKYAKPATSKEYSLVSEPIFGLETIREGKPVIITQGIADAITVQQSGYPCISPVTTDFKKSDKPKLLAKLIDQSVSRVYVIQDSEPPSNRYDEDRNKIETSQSSPGIRGAVKTAQFLTENGIETRVNTPPRIGSDKIDVHDFLHEGWGTLETLIRSAKPPDHFDCYSTTSKEKTGEYKENRSPIDSNSENQSALFSLDLCDVTGQSVGYRGINPLGHTGDSEDYYVVYNREWSFDHKRSVGYNPLLFLLCEAGERRIEEPYGALSNKDRFVAWKHAKENRLVSEEDPIPHFGLVYVALDSKLCVEEEIDDGWKIPPEAYNQALETVQEEHGLNPGREPLGSGTTTASVPHFPNLLDSEEEIESELTLKEARSRCEQTIDQALAHDSQYDLIDALPALGKSYGVVKWAATNDTPLTVLTPRRDLHEQNKDWCKEFGLNFYTLPAFHRNCGCMAGDHGSEWKDRVRSLYNAGVSGRQIHEMARYRFGEELPCMRNGPCTYLSQLGFDPEDYDVLLGNYLHAHMENVVEDRVVAIDESPTSAFIEGFAPDEVASAVSHFLNTHEELPFKNYTDLLENRSDKYRREDAEDWFETHQPDLMPNATDMMMSKNQGSHAKAPLMTYVLLVGEDLGNQWEHASIDKSRVAARNRNPQTEHNEDELTFLIPPSLDEARNVIGLDGTPCKRQWDLCLGHSVEHWQVLDDVERGSYIRDVLDQRIYQMSTYAKPYCGRGNVKLKKDSALIKQVGEQERSLPDLISSQQAIRQYRDAGLLNSVGNTLYYGNLIGLNEFGNSRLGVIIGSPHYGDTYLEKWGAFANEVVKWDGGERGLNKNYGPFGNELVEEMREFQILQAIMRFGRDGDGTKVFVSTGAIPEWVPLAGKGKVAECSDGMESVLNAIEDRKEWKSSDLLTHVEGRKTRALDSEDNEPLSGRRVRKYLTTLCERGYVSRSKSGNGYVYRNESVQDAPRGLYLEFEKGT